MNTFSDNAQQFLSLFKCGSGESDESCRRSLVYATQTMGGWSVNKYAKSLGWGWHRTKNTMVELGLLDA